jgi:hypothetical protein
MVHLMIVGRVTTVAHDHIFLLVHQCWNVTIPRVCHQFQSYRSFNQSSIMLF